MFFRVFLGVVIGCAGCTAVALAKERGEADRSGPPPVPPKPVALKIDWPELHLHGPDDRRQLVISGRDDSAVVQDWTREVTWTSSNPDVAAVSGTRLVPKADGVTTLVAEAGGVRDEMPVRVSDVGGPRRVGFETEVLPVLSKHGCSSGACHGAPSGKGGFRLSLRAFDPGLDRRTVTREGFGRRVNPIDPDQSLLLLKPLAAVSHGGGQRLRSGDRAHHILREWIAQGARPDPADAAHCVRLEVVPSGGRTLRLGDGGQQIAAAARFSDGTSRGVTELAVYESSNPEVATVDESGLVTPRARGETVILVRYLEHIEAVPLMFTEAVPGFEWNAPPTRNDVDELVDAKLRRLQYLPSDRCDDSEFLRRVYLDVIGVLPTPAETREFLSDSGADKRARLIDALLERDEFAKFWALKWGDLLRMSVKALGKDGALKYHRWLQEAIRQNLPYDEFTRRLLTSRGSTFANPPANFYRTAEDMNACVESVSQVFLGSRIQCAKCHNHPFEPWTQDNYYGMAAFFNRVRRTDAERNGEWFVSTALRGEVVQPRTGQTMQPWLPGPGERSLEPGLDRRVAFARWLTQPDNPYFARMEVNRIWAQLFARGIVEPIDDFRASNPPANAELLDALARDFVDQGFDRKHLLRKILNSRTYQASHRPRPLSRDDRTYFSHQVPRLLQAEQLFDAIHQTLGTTPDFSPLPGETRATHLPAPDLVANDFLKSFGQPARNTSCACERVEEPNLGMAIELLNGKTVRGLLRDPANRFRKAVAEGRTAAEIVEELYLAALCRPPSETELRHAIEHCEKRETTVDGLEDVCWALIKHRRVSVPALVSQVAIRVDHRNPKCRRRKCLAGALGYGLPCNRSRQLRHQVFLRNSCRLSLARTESRASELKPAPRRRRFVSGQRLEIDTDFVPRSEAAMPVEPRVIVGNHRALVNDHWSGRHHVSRLTCRRG